MTMFLIFSTTLFFLLISTSNAHTQGTVTVDTLTFDKILRTFDIVLAKFDDKYPYGDHQDQFKKLAENAANTKRLLIVEIPIADHGDRENEQLAKEYGIKKEDYPVYKLFLKDKPKPIDYTGDRTENDLKRFISQYTNLWFGLPGTLEALDNLARDFFDASSNKDENGQQTLLEKARELNKEFVDKKEKKSGESYLKIMEAIAKQGIEFVQREGRRVQNLLQGKITNEKKEEIQHRANILLSFKSAKESIIDTLNEGKEKILNAAEQVKEAVTGDKDL
jgi:endoplasmic reticulum protein 29